MYMLPRASVEASFVAVVKVTAVLQYVVKMWVFTDSVGVSYW